MRPFIVGMYGAGRTGGQARTRCGRGCALKLPPAACDPPTCSAAFSARVIVSLLDLAVLGAWRCAPVVLACVSLRAHGQQARVSSEASGRGFCPRSPSRLPCFECFAGALATCCLRAACWPSLLLAAGLAPALMCLSPLAPAQARFGETRGTLTVTGTPRRGPRLGGGRKLQEGVPPLGCDTRGLVPCRRLPWSEQAGSVGAVTGLLTPFRLRLATAALQTEQQPKAENIAFLALGDEVCRRQTLWRKFFIPVKLTRGAAVTGWLPPGPPAAGHVATCARARGSAQARYPHPRPGGARRCRRRRRVAHCPRRASRCRVVYLRVCLRVSLFVFRLALSTVCNFMCN